MAILKKTLILLTLNYSITACSLKNAIDERALECGTEAKDHNGPYVRLLYPDGQPINTSQGFHIEAVNGNATRSTISSRGCVLIDSSAKDTLAVHSSVNGRKLGTLITELSHTRKEKLSDVSRNDLIISCDKTIFAKDSFYIPSSRRGDLSGFILSAFMKSSTGSIAIWDQQLLTESSPRIDIPTSLADGQYALSISVRDIFQPDAGEKVYNCPVTTDRASPTFSLNSQDQSFDLNKLELSPGQTIQLKAIDQNPE
ncbi:MAG: hypothetical protein EOP04_09605, partial [Proteobacteria bacterium]